MCACMYCDICCCSPDTDSIAIIIGSIVIVEHSIFTMLKNKYLKESIPAITLVILMWLIGTLFIIMQDYKNTIKGLQETLITLRLEMKISQQKIKEVQLLCIDKTEYLRRNRDSL